jgi:hypothetical protein
MGDLKALGVPSTPKSSESMPGVKKTGVDTFTTLSKERSYENIVRKWLKSLNFPVRRTIEGLFA